MQTTKVIAGKARLDLSQTMQLKRILSMGDLVLMILGTVIGSGIFLVSGTVLHAVGGSTPWALAAWFIGGVLSLLGALTYGELSAMKPEAGGLYLYIHDCFGRFPAFLFGWTLFFVISSGSVATLSVAFGNYLGALLSLSPLGVKIAAILMILLITAVNIRGTRSSANLLNYSTILKVIAIVFLGVVLLWQGKEPFLGSASPAPSLPVLSGFGASMISVLWAYEGWQYATYSAGEVVDPQRTFPFAFLAGTAALIALYLFSNVAYIRALGIAGVANSTRVAAAASDVVAGTGTSRLVAVTILVAIFSSAHSVLFNAPRVYYAMANDGVFFQALSRIDPRFGTPALAIASGGLWSIVLAVTGSFEQLLTYVVFVGWAFYALAAASIFVYRRRFPDLARPYRVPGYPWTPAIFIIAALSLVANTVFTQPKRAAIGLGLVFLGAPAYAFWRRSAKVRASEGGDLV